MNGARAFAALLFALVAGAIGYGIGVAQNVPAGVATGVPAMGYYPWHFGFGFFGLLFPLLFLFLIFGLLRAAFWGARPYGSWGDRHGHLDELHREMHRRDQAGSGGAAGGQT